MRRTLHEKSDPAAVYALVFGEGWGLAVEAEDLPGDDQGAVGAESNDLTSQVKQIVNAVGKLPISQQDSAWLVSVIEGLAQRYLHVASAPMSGCNAEQLSNSRDEGGQIRHDSASKQGGPTSFSAWKTWWNGDRQVRRRSLRFRNRGSVGVFFDVAGAIVAFPEALHECERGERFVYPLAAHANVWPRLLKLVTPLAHLREVLLPHYPVFPRGRAVYDTRSGKFSIVLSDAIPYEHRSLILREFGLLDRAAEVAFDDTDLHYRMDDRDVELWQGIVDLYELKEVIVLPNGLSVVQ